MMSRMTLEEEEEVQDELAELQKEQNKETDDARNARMRALTERLDHMEIMWDGLVLRHEFLLKLLVQIGLIPSLDLLGE